MRSHHAMWRRKGERAWFIRLNTHRREICKLVIKAVIVANVHEEDAGSQRVGSHRRKEPYSFGGAGRVLEGKERGLSVDWTDVYVSWRWVRRCGEGGGVPGEPMKQRSC